MVPTGHMVDNRVAGVYSNQSETSILLGNETSMDNQMTAFVSAADAAEMAGVSKQIIIRSINSKLLPAERVGNQFVIPKAVVERVFARCSKCHHLENPKAPGYAKASKITRRVLKRA